MVDVEWVDEFDDDMVVVVVEIAVDDGGALVELELVDETRVVDSANVTSGVPASGTMVTNSAPSQPVDPKMKTIQAKSVFQVIVPPLRLRTPR